MNINFVTSNPLKVEIAKTVLNNTAFEIVQNNIETPEIQAFDSEAIAKYSAKWAAEKLQEPAVVTDAGYYITALNGFPGPFIKYINKWLSSNDLIKLMEGKTNREVVVKGYLAYCEPNQEPIVFPSFVKGQIATQPVLTEKAGNTSINEIFIPDGFEKVESEIPREEMVVFWSQVEIYWKSLADHLQNK